MNEQCFIEYLPTSGLVPYARNSRTHSDEQVAQIAGSIREFGFTNPVLIDAEDGIIAGHGRVMAANRLGLNEVPCIRLSHLTGAQKRAYIIADNKLALNSGWDDEMLKIELQELDDIGFDLDLIGFSDEELGIYIDLEESSDKEPPPVSEPKSNYIEQHGVIVLCKDEVEQEVVFNRLVEMGYTVKVVST